MTYPHQPGSTLFDGAAAHEAHCGIEQDMANLFRQITAGSETFTRRMAITMGDILGYGPLTLTLELEGMGLLKKGSFDWFKANGSITREQIEQVRKEATDRIDQQETGTETK